MTTKSFVIIMDGINETQRSLIHMQVKAHAEVWWHETPDVWIVASDEPASAWRDRLKVFVPTLPGFLLVLALPPNEHREWSVTGERSKWTWFYENYSSPRGGPVGPAPESKASQVTAKRLKLNL